MRLTRVAGLTVAVAATAALGVSVASALVGGADPASLPQSLVPVPGSARIDQIAPDPDGGRGWAVRLYDAVSGAACAELGRVDAGRFGRVGGDGRFRELAPDEGGTCGSLASEPAILAIGHYPGSSGRPPRTVLFGRVGGDVAAIAVTPSAGPTVQIKPGPGGAFVLARPGSVAPTALPVRITLTNGKQVAYDWT